MSMLNIFTNSICEIFLKIFFFKRDSEDIIEINNVLNSNILLVVLEKEQVPLLLSCMSKMTLKFQK